MQNIEVKNKQLEKTRIDLYNALRDGDDKAQQEAFENFAEAMQNDIIAKANATINQTVTSYSDEQILVNRGVIKQFTAEEKKYFNAVIDRGGFDNVNLTFPTSVLADVFKNIKENHPLLSLIDAKPTEILAKYIFAKPNKAVAFWGPICEDIKQMILEGFEVVDIKSSRLSGFVPVCKGMLELGPVWFGTYVMELMEEIMAASLETAVVAGNGKNQPIGMIKKLSGAVDSVYPDKPAIAVTELSPIVLGGIRAGLAEAKTDSPNVVLIVNPITYWLKVFPNLAFKNDAGTWILDSLATGEKIVKSYAAPIDRGIVGDPMYYFLGVASDVVINKYTETLAIEDMDLFIAKFFGYGLAKDANAFFVMDLSGVAGGTAPTLEKFTANTGDNANSTITATTEIAAV